MNEANHQEEYEPTELSAIRKYYNDVFLADTNYSHVVMALDEVFAASTDGMLVGVEAIIDSPLLPSEEDLVLRPRIAKEHLALLPLAHIGPELELSSIDPKKVRQWYDDALEGVRMIGQEDHSISCSEFEDPARMKCAASTICPYRFVEHYLSDEALNPDFSKLKYLDDSRRVVSIVFGKLDLAVKHGVLEDEYAKGLGASYILNFNEYFHAGKHSLPHESQ